MKHSSGALPPSSMTGYPGSAPPWPRCRFRESCRFAGDLPGKNTARSKGHRGSSRGIAPVPADRPGAVSDQGGILAGILRRLPWNCSGIDTDGIQPGINQLCFPGGLRLNSMESTGRLRRIPPVCCRHRWWKFVRYSSYKYSSYILCWFRNYSLKTSND